MEEEKTTQEVNETAKTTTQTTTESKQNWFKSHMAVCIICTVVVIAAIVGVVIFVMNNNGGQSPEKVVETYVQAMQEGNSDKIMAITDLKGVYAWEKSGRKAEKFEEEYKKVSDSDVKQYESKTKSALDAAFGMLKAFGKVDISTKNIERPEELVKDLYKVKATIKIKVSVFGTEQEQEQPITLIVYNGKYIGSENK